MTTVNANATQPNNSKLTLQVTNDLTVQIIPNDQYEFLMDSNQVAAGYGVTPQNIREHQRVNTEFIEGKHFIRSVRISDTLPKGVHPDKVFWTKRGIVRLGFFIKSERAKMFRDWAEDLIIHLDEKKELPQSDNGVTLSTDQVLKMMVSIMELPSKKQRMNLTQYLLPNTVQKIGRSASIESELVNEYVAPGNTFMVTTQIKEKLEEKSGEPLILNRVGRALRSAGINVACKKVNGMGRRGYNVQFKF